MGVIFFSPKGTHFSWSVGSGQVFPVAVPGLGIQSGGQQSVSGSVANSAKLSLGKLVTSSGSSK